VHSHHSAISLGMWIYAHTQHSTSTSWIVLTGGVSCYLASMASLINIFLKTT